MQTETTTPHANSITLWTTGCCPRFDAGPWNEKEIVWTDKPFVREHVRSAFHIPLTMTGRVKHGMKLIAGAGAKPARQIMLSDEVSPWRSDLYIESTQDVPGAEMAHLSGTFLTKVFEGPFRNAPKWEREMTRFVQARGKSVKHLYLGYTTCPRCAKAYGKNYVVLLAQIAGAVA